MDMGKTKKVIACFKELNFKFNIKSFEDRLIAQKTNCLLQYKGINNGFAYSLYAYGPYSPDLTKEYYQTPSAFSNFETDVELSLIEKNKVNKLKDIFDLKPKYLEIATTYAYSIIQMRNEPIDAYKFTKRFKSHYSDAKIAVGISKAKEYLNERLIRLDDDVDAELKIWRKRSLELLT